MSSDSNEITRPAGRLARQHNLGDWAEARASWSWERAATELDCPGGLVNLAHEAVDRHAHGAARDRVALLWESVKGEVERYSFDALHRHSNRFANALAGLGVGRGERVFFFMDRIPELYFGVFGALKRGAIAAPLFSSLGPEALRERIARGQGAVLVTTPKLLRRLDVVRSALPSLRHVIVVGQWTASPVPAGCLAYRDLVESASEECAVEHTDAETPSILHFTSGSTGVPKGAVHVHGAAVAYHATGKHVLDLRPDDVLWCTADPGWVTGTSYGMFAPWLNGVTNLVYEGAFGAERWYELIERHGVTVLYTAPTALRLLARAGRAPAARRDLSSLRLATCSGEPLDAGAIRWSVEVLGLPVHDQWWQTETGTTMISNYPGMPIRPGSMGRPFPGIEAALLDPDGVEITEPMVEGRLALRSGWPSMFRAYWGDEEAYRSRFRDGWYLTGDRARRDRDGYFWFVRREDDAINTAGHLVGPFEVERVLLEHESVAEAAVIGKPHPVAMEVVKAFVTLERGVVPGEALRREILAHARRALGAAIAPREIDFVASLPRTRSGKILRRLLRAQELGMSEGDTSTLEVDGAEPDGG